MITLKEVEVMLAVCKAGSFMGAARELGITQGNVSKIVAGLEKNWPQRCLCGPVMV